MSSVTLSTLPRVIKQQTNDNRNNRDASAVEIEYIYEKCSESEYLQVQQHCGDAWGMDIAETLFNTVIPAI